MPKKDTVHDQWAQEKKSLKSKNSVEMIYAANHLLLQSNHPELKDVVMEYRSRILDVALTKKTPQETRLSAFKALSKLGLEDARKDLNSIFTNKKEDMQIISEAAQLVRKQNGKLMVAPEMVTQLIGQFKNDGDWSPQYYAIIALRYFEDPRIVPTLVEALNHKQPAVHREALYGLGEQKASDQVPVINEIMHSRRSQELVAASIALEQIGTKEAVKILSDEALYKTVLQQSKSDIDGRFTAGALAQFHLARVDDDLIALAINRDTEIGQRAQYGLIKRRCERAISELAPFYLKGSWTFSLLLGLITKIIPQSSTFDNQVAKNLAAAFEKTSKKVLEEGLNDTRQTRYHYIELSSMERKRFDLFKEAVLAEIKNTEIKQLVLELFSKPGERDRQKSIDEATRMVKAQQELQDGGGDRAYLFTHILDQKIKKIYARIAYDDYDAYLRGKDILKTTTDTLAVLEAMNESLENIISDLDEHGKVNESLYGDLNQAYFKKEKKKIELQITKMKESGKTSTIFADYIKKRDGKKPGVRS